ncbi:hypothetical protein SSYRP_v1c06880 [Spiroplasma syrphidicola EA-1]|uniref:Lipoprotein n=1 Tax=Spiroplasma syrphidicola EA-1 TaxID=1276229 RepID=R4U6N4_9MOLU|nr:lipoprotein [Spiroplasma syrphidicola]AGM26278.1 hypothetical protein SSYRP_v1c06880 [Spiroplasma syrphidicola EA-1]
MKKLISLLGAVTLTATSATAVVACHTKTSDKDTFNIKDSYKVIPNGFSLAEQLKKDGNNIDKLQIKFLPGLTKATIRYMGVTTKSDFISKTVNIESATNDLSKIITKKSISIAGIDKKFYEKDENGKPTNIISNDVILKAINLLNQTNLTTDDVDLVYKPLETKIELTGKGQFSGTSVELNDEPMEWTDLLEQSNLNEVYFPKGLVEAFQKESGNLGTLMMTIFPVAMEFFGARNPLLELYQQKLTDFGYDAMGGSGPYSESKTIDPKVEAKISDNKGSITLGGTLNKKDSSITIFSKGSLTFNFTVLIDENDKYVTSTHSPLESWKATDPNNEIIETLSEHYDQNSQAKLVHDLVAKYYGKDFATKFENVLLEDFWVTDFTPTSAILTPKPGSMIFRNHDKSTLIVNIFAKSPAYSYHIKVNFA